MHGHCVGITCACTHICTHAYTGPSSVLPTWYLSSWGSQWSSSRLHDHCQETDLHLLPDVQADANWSQSWDCPLQHEQKVKERYLCKSMFSVCIPVLFSPITVPFHLFLMSDQSKIAVHFHIKFQIMHCKLISIHKPSACSYSACISSWNWDRNPIILIPSSVSFLYF